LNAASVSKRCEGAPKVEHEREHLELARRHVVEGKLRIARQQLLIRELQAAGHPTGLAWELLQSLQETLRQMEAHHNYLATHQNEA
jgi:hypothetical protein